MHLSLISSNMRAAYYMTCTPKSRDDVVTLLKVLISVSSRRQLAGDRSKH